MGDILVIEHRNTLGVRDAINYKWQGDDEVYLVPSLFPDEIDFTKREHILNIGPFQLYSVGFDWESGRLHAFRVRGFFWWIPVVIYKSTRIFDLIYRRVIITLAVWGLADYQQQRVPYYGDIHIMQWIKRKKKHG